MAKKRRRHDRHRTLVQGDGQVRTTAKPSATQGPSRSRAEKKELVRQRREEMQRRQQRALHIRRLMLVTGVGAVAALLLFQVTKPKEQPTPSPSPSPSTQLPGMLTSEAPWPANAAEAQARSDADGLPPVGDGQLVDANLRILVRGEPVVVPKDIGIDGTTDTSLQTHDTTGTIHVESKTPYDFTLGEFFDVWGVRLTDTCIGGYCANGSETLQVFVDGTEVPGNPRDVPLNDEAVIVLTFGTPDQLPNPIPSSFDFSSITQ
jgi:hypothetical protein